jgi:hypothetical protein
VCIPVHDASNFFYCKNYDELETITFTVLGTVLQIIEEFVLVFQIHQKWYLVRFRIRIWIWILPSNQCYGSGIWDLILDPGTWIWIFSILDPGCTGYRIRNTAINKQKIMKNLGLYSSLTFFVIFEY